MDAGDNVRGLICLCLRLPPTTSMSDHVKLMGRALRTKTVPHGSRAVVPAGENVLIYMLRDEKQYYLGTELFLHLWKYEAN